MINVNCLNNIASVGLDLFSSDYNANAAFEEADAVLVRSAKMHDMELPDNLLAIAKELVLVLIIFHLINVQIKRVLLYLIHQVLMPMQLKEHVLAAFFSFKEIYLAVSSG